MRGSVNKNISPIHYGTNLNQSITFPLTIGSTEHLSDFEVDAILSWLTGHNTYKWLEYVDSDHYLRYKCFLNNIQAIYVNGLATAFKCEVVCDSQFAYEYPISQEFLVSATEKEINFFNRSSYNGYLKPKVDLYFSDESNSISIINETDNNREFKVNYFDRVVTDENTIDYIMDTTLSSVISQDLDPNEYFSWQEGSLPAGNWNDLLYGDGTYVLLPVNGNKAQISVDKGLTWEERELPVSGTFTGCYGAGGFVAIQTGVDSDVVLYSPIGDEWIKIADDSTLPVKQRWNSVCFAEIDAFSDGYYIAVGNSGIAACSLSGLNWRSLDVNIPDGNWTKIKYGNGRAIAISENTDRIVYCTSITRWKEGTLPKSAAWKDLVWGTAGWVIIPDSVVSSPQAPVALMSLDGMNWTICNLPINSWKSVAYAKGSYIAVSTNKYAKSMDGINWQIKDLPRQASFIISDDTKMIVVGESLLFASMLDVVYGTFSFVVSETNIMSEVVISAQIANVSNVDADFSSNGEVQLYIQTDESGQTVEYDYMVLTNDLRTGLGTEGVSAKATWDADTKTVTVNYICDPNHESVMEALFSVKVNYRRTVITDLGMESLHLNFDNKNQIITSNREIMNPYKYFNMKFLRLLKGNNTLKMKTDSGTVRVVITCEFLRKVGGF